jgi:hypothetical protein
MGSLSTVSRLKTRIIPGVAKGTSLALRDVEGHSTTNIRGSGYETVAGQGMTSH